MDLIFPLNTRIMNDYSRGTARFGANRWTDKDKDGIVDRDEARSHAGCDLYCKEDSTIFACEDGVVFNAYDNFYLSVGCVEIIGKNFTIRYAEMKPFVKQGQRVKQGDVIGYVKTCKGLLISMLHIEFYKEISDLQPLTDRTNMPYQRRADLINPTAILKQLQEKRDAINKSN